SHGPKGRSRSGQKRGNSTGHGRATLLLRPATSGPGQTGSGFRPLSSGGQEGSQRLGGSRRHSQTLFRTGRLRHGAQGNQARVGGRSRQPEGFHRTSGKK